MATPINSELRAALSRDLKTPSTKGAIKVVDDPARKVFTTNREGAVFVFAHNQPDPAFWVGTKHYGSGPTSRVRIRRTKVEDGTPSPERTSAGVAEKITGQVTLS
jgi:hypothetical protein